MAGLCRGSHSIQEFDARSAPMNPTSVDHCVLLAPRLGRVPQRQQRPRHRNVAERGAGYCIIVAAAVALLVHRPAWTTPSTVLRPRSAYLLTCKQNLRTAQTSSATLQAVGFPELCAACTLPTCLGFWRSEYGVSYGYGGALAISGVLLQRDPMSFVPAAVMAQALCLLLYGARLNLFLLYREVFLQRFRDARNRIEAKAKSKGGRLARMPFILTCSLLYLGLVAPTVLAFKASAAGAWAAAGASSAAARGFTGCIVAMYVGWALAMAGDFYKSVMKARNGDTLVTGGPYALLRHPNYQGEQLLWIANFVAGIIAVATLGFKAFTTATAVWAVASVLGVVGINLVLMQATGGLEARQREAYGNDPFYKEWVARTWKGFSLDLP